eukprot:scaffold154_cov373-Prasinococcus_capsulatus_cf.AAC.22
MGVSGLWTLLEGHDCHFTVPAEDVPAHLEGKRIAIDLAHWYFNAVGQKELGHVSRAPYVKLTFERCHFVARDAQSMLTRTTLPWLLSGQRLVTLLRFGVKPVAVIDGVAPKEKRELLQQRALARDGASFQGTLRARGGLKRSDTCTSLLDQWALGCPTFQAHGEGEACCAHLEVEGIVDGVCTTDADAFLFGARRVYKRLHLDVRKIQSCVVEGADTSIACSKGFDREAMIVAAVLMGGDYNRSGVSSMGGKKSSSFIGTLQERMKLTKRTDVTLTDFCWETLDQERDDDKAIQRLIHRMRGAPGLRERCEKAAQLYLHQESPLKDPKRTKKDMEWTSMNLPDLQETLERYLGWHKETVLRKIFPLLLEHSLCRDTLDFGTALHVPFKACAVVKEAGRRTENARGWRYLLKWQCIVDNDEELRDCLLEILKTSEPDRRSIRKSLVEREAPELLEPVKQHRTKGRVGWKAAVMNSRKITDFFNVVPTRPQSSDGDLATPASKEEDDRQGDCVASVASRCGHASIISVSSTEENDTSCQAGDSQIVLLDGSPSRKRAAKILDRNNQHGIVGTPRKKSTPRQVASCPVDKEKPVNGINPTADQVRRACAADRITARKLMPDLVRVDMTRSPSESELAGLIGGPQVAARDDSIALTAQDVAGCPVAPTASYAEKDISVPSDKSNEKPSKTGGTLSPGLDTNPIPPLDPVVPVHAHLATNHNEPQGNDKLHSACSDGEEGDCDAVCYMQNPVDVDEEEQLIRRENEEFLAGLPPNYGSDDDLDYF